MFFCCLIICFSLGTKSRRKHIKGLAGYPDAIRFRTNETVFFPPTSQKPPCKPPRILPETSPKPSGNLPETSPKPSRNPPETYPKPPPPCKRPLNLPETSPKPSGHLSETSLKPTRNLPETYPKPARNLPETSPKETSASRPHTASHARTHTHTHRNRNRNRFPDWHHPPISNPDAIRFRTSETFF